MLDDTKAETIGSAIVSRNLIEMACGLRDKTLAETLAAVDDLRAYAERMQNALAASGPLQVRLDDYRAEASERHKLATFSISPSDVSEKEEMIRRMVDRGLWSYLMEASGMRLLMDRQALEEFDRSIANDPPEGTIDNVTATFEVLTRDARRIFLRGLANALGNLDRRFKSHSTYRYKDRTILNHIADGDGYISYNSHCLRTLVDIEKALVVATGASEKLIGWTEHLLRQQCHLKYGPKSFQVDSPFFKVNVFKNGNAHLWIKEKEHLKLLNIMLHEYYGDILADDLKPEADSDDLLRDRNTLPSRDLQFYPTPDRLAEKIVSDLYLPEGSKVLEPSAGDGALVAPLLRQGHAVTAIEIDPVRAGRLELLSGCKVIRGNFMQVQANPNFDAVVMNPPFCNTLWIDHVVWAAEFLKPGGLLVAILPITLELGEQRKHKAFRAWLTENFWPTGYRSYWSDLPEGSFSEVGTNVNTVLLKARKK